MLRYLQPSVSKTELLILPAFCPYFLIHPISSPTSLIRKLLFASSSTLPSTTTEFLLLKYLSDAFLSPVLLPLSNLRHLLLGRGVFLYDHTYFPHPPSIRYGCQSSFQFFLFCSFFFFTVCFEAVSDSLNDFFYLNT